MCAVSGHRCACPPCVPIFKEFNHGYLEWQLSLYWEVSLYQSRLLMSSSAYTCQATWQVSLRVLVTLTAHIRVPLPARGLHSGDVCPKFPPLLPTHLSPHWHHFSPGSPRPQSLSNSELYIFTPHRLSPSSLSWLRLTHQSSANITLATCSCL